MATIYFQLERSKRLKDDTHPIYLVVKIKEGGKEKRFRYYTGRSSLPKHWLGKGETKKVSSKAPGAAITNSRLDTLRLGADAILTNAKNLKIAVTINYFSERFKEEVLGIQQSREDQVEVSFFDHLKNYIETKKGILQPATIKTYNTLKKSLEEFQKETGYIVTFESLNHVFITLYTKYLIEECEVLNNTLAKRIATLKAFLSEMKRIKVNKNSDYEYFEAKRDGETTIMYLTEAELMSVYNVELSNRTLSEVRDAFCFACLTGIRFSDWGRLNTNNVATTKDEDGNNIMVLRFTMFKVHKEVTVPLSEYALEILEKYKDHKVRLDYGQLLPVYSNQETNRSLKNIAKKAELNDVIQEVKKSGAKRITTTNHKYEILTCHDARNTFATLYLENKGRPEVLQKLLGHSNFKQTMRYVKIVEKTVISDYIKTMGKNKAKILPIKIA